MPTTRKSARQTPQPVELPRELQKQLLPDYRVGPGDVILVEADDFNSEVRLPADQIIRSDGTIGLDQYGRLQVSGMNVAEIEAAVEQRLREQDGEDESVHVRLMEVENQAFYVVGEVKSPASFPLKGRETVLDAIMEAGGLTDRADRHNIILSRATDPTGCGTVLPICYRQIVQLGDSSTNYQIMPGDRVYVPSMSLTQELTRPLFPGAGHQCSRCAPQCAAQGAQPCAPQCACGSH